MRAILKTLRAAFTDPAAFRKAHAGQIVALAGVALAVFPPHTWPYELAAFLVGGSALPVIAQTQNHRRRATRPDAGGVLVTVLIGIAIAAVIPAVFTR